MNEKKAALRRELLTRAKSMPAAEKQASDRAILTRVAASEAYRDAGTVFCFVGRGEEIDTRPLLGRILSDGKRLCVPLCAGAGEMEARQIAELAQLRPGRYGILEPPLSTPKIEPGAIDLSVIPCVGAARDGRRLGRGGGYYDRFLTGFSGKALLLCRGMLLREDIPREAHDVVIPDLITDGMMK